MSSVVTRMRHLLGRTPVRTFILYPLITATYRIVRDRRVRMPSVIGLLLLVWGYLQYRLTGSYRQNQGAGSRGMETMPAKLIKTGPYAYSRNPMYLGHLIFLLGLALSFGSRPAWILLLANVAWFQGRVSRDERRLRQQFGDEYDQYRRRVKRWIPYAF